MKKFLLIFILTLSWSNISLAEVLNLYCEYIEGKVKEKEEIENIPITDYSIGDRFQDYLKGYKIKINVSKQKIIEAPQYNQKDGWKTIFEEDEILWYRSEADLDVSVHYILNRYSGKLREETRILTGDRKNDTFMVLIFQCSKAERLF
ncbi:hypothetical protein [Candidatus Pelagibacter sp. HIMB1746]|uniref:hypothetical protein n=1 Tax=Candidatus Pelagibacter sp. HIMB1746 TaxID=3413370 RepID=UPI003F833DDD